MRAILGHGVYTWVEWGLSYAWCVYLSRMRAILGLVGVPESNEAYLRPMEEEPPVGHLLSPAHIPRVLPQQLHLR